MTRFLGNLRFYHWMLAGAAVLVIGWLGVSFVAPSSSEPAATEALPERPPAIVMEVNGMYCSNCGSNVERSLRRLNGVEQVAVHLEEGEAKIWVEAPETLGDTLLQQTVTEAGYEPGTIRRR